MRALGAVKRGKAQTPSSFPQTRQPRGGAVAYLVPTVGASTRPRFACKLIAFSLSRAQLVPWCRWCQAPSGGRPLSTASRPIPPSAAHSRARRAQPSALLLLRVYGHGAGSVCRVRLRSPKRLPMRACAESAQGHRVDRVPYDRARLRPGVAEPVELSEALLGFRFNTVGCQGFLSG